MSIHDGEGKFQPFREQLREMDSVLRRYIEAAIDAVHGDTLEERSEKLRIVFDLEKQLGVLYPEWFNGTISLAMKAIILSPEMKDEFDFSVNEGFEEEIAELTDEQVQTLIARQPVETFFSYATDAVLARRCDGGDIVAAARERGDMTEEELQVIQVIFDRFDEFCKEVFLAEVDQLDM